jgi:type II secretory ATPase GspE/PulE/Tfp pilus assembly ATPase PilB-like protein
MNTATIKHIILAKNNVTEITKVAVGEGMATLRQDGINKILLGLTDWEQIRTI